MIFCGIYTILDGILALTYSVTKFINDSALCIQKLEHQFDWF